MQTAPDGSSAVVDDDEDEIKPWDKFFQTPPPENIGSEEVPKEWTLLHGGRSVEDGLIASAAELVSDLLWGNLALPIDKCLEKLRRVNEIYAEGAPADLDYLKEMTTRIDEGIAKEITDTGPPVNPVTGAPMTHDQRQEELLLRRECREMVELSTQQLEEMSEKKGEFGNECTPPRRAEAKQHSTGCLLLRLLSGSGSRGAQTAS